MLFPLENDSHFIQRHGCGGSLVTQLVWLCDSMNYSPPGSSVHRLLQARMLEWVAISFFRESSWPRDRTQVSCTAGRFFTWVTRTAREFPRLLFWCISELESSIWLCSNPSNYLFTPPLPWGTGSYLSSLGIGLICGMRAKDTEEWVAT